MLTMIGPNYSCVRWEKPSARTGDLWWSVRTLEKKNTSTVELHAPGLGGLSILRTALVRGPLGDDGNGETLDEMLFRVWKSRPRRTRNGEKISNDAVRFSGFSPGLSGTQSGSMSREIWFCVCYCYPHFIAPVLESFQHLNAMRKGHLLCTRCHLGSCIWSKLPRSVMILQLNVNAIVFKWLFALTGNEPVLGTLVLQTWTN